jgi:hypothetical protein
MPGVVFVGSTLIIRNFVGEDDVDHLFPRPGSYSAVRQDRVRVRGGLAVNKGIAGTRGPRLVYVAGLTNGSGLQGGNAGTDWPAAGGRQIAEERISVDRFFFQKERAPLPAKILGAQALRKVQQKES